MPTFEHRIKAFVKLGDIIRNTVSGSQKETELNRILSAAIDKSISANPWFISSHVDYALEAIALMLNENKLPGWLHNYQIPEIGKKKAPAIGVITAGNIPAVGFHDFLCVLAAGCRFAGKLSSDDPFLLPAFGDILCGLDDGFSSLMSFVEENDLHAGAIIATGGNNTARYFEHKYGNLPHIFRRNRNGVAVLSGNETTEQLIKLACDVFMHFGLGCRNVSKLYVPVDYDFTEILQVFKTYDYLKDHKPYMNNYIHNKAILKLQNTRFFDNGLLLITQNPAIPSPVAVLNYESYHGIEQLVNHLKLNADQIQCVLSETALPLKTIRFGTSQQPTLVDYADDVDTMRFILQQIR